VSASPRPAHHEGGECVDGTDKSNLVASVDAEQGNGTVTGTGPLCEPVDILLSIYKVPDAWQPGEGFPGKALPGGGFSAVPQHVIQTARGTLEGGQTLKLHVDVPDRGNVQIDLYYPPEITDVDVDGTGAPFLAGAIWQIAAPSDCEEQTSGPPPPSHSTTPPKPPKNTSPAAPAVVQPIPVPPAAPKPPQLAETGSNSTVPLVGSARSCSVPASASA